MRKIAMLLFAAIIPCAFGQSVVRYDSNNTTSATNVPSGAQAPVYTLPFSKVTVCGYPAVPESGSTCTNTMPIYSDQAMTKPIQQPLIADSQGRFGFWTPPALYSYSVATSKGTYVGTWPLYLNFSPGGSGIFSSLITKLPRVDVRHPDFAAGCPNAADPTGILDSTCAIQSAINFSNATGLANPVGSYPVVYVPYGSYKITSALRLPWQIKLQCDATAATNIVQYNNTANGITVYQPTNGANTDIFELDGGIDNCGISSHGGHLHTGTLLEVDAGIGTKYNNLDIFNSGGRGIFLRGSPERMYFINTVITSVRQPLMGEGNNETQFLKTLISAPGFSEPGGNYGYGPNCVSGTCVNGTWNGTMNLVSASADGGNPSTATFVVTCTGNCVVDANNASQPYLSPITAGMWFQVAGIPDITALNGTWKAVTVSNNTPAGNFTVTAQLITGQFTYGPDESMMQLNPVNVVASGSATVTGATWKPMIWAQGNAAVVWGGDTSKFDSASIKLTSNSQCFQAWNPANNTITHFYCEGFPANSQPRLNPDVTEFGYLPWTNLTAPFTCTPVSGAPCLISVINNDWFFNYTNDPADAANPAIAAVTQLMSMVPCDYNPSSTAQSSCAPPGVLRNQYELMSVVFTQGKQGVVYSRNAAGSTAHNIAWPVGSHLGWNNASGISNAGGANNLHLFDNHLESMNDGSGNTGMPNHGYGVGCNDNGPNICGTIINGRTPDYVMVFPVGTAGQASPHANIDVENSTLGGALPANETIGIGVIKVQGGGGVIIKGTDGFVPQTGELSTVLNGVTYNSSIPVIGVQYTNFSDGSPLSTSSVDVQDSVTNTTLHTEANQPTRGWFETKLVNTPSTAITGGGTAIGFGRQYTNGDCFWDVGVTHSTNQTCFQGGPANSGANAGIFHYVWTGTANRQVFTADDLGRLTIQSPLVATSTATFGTSQIRQFFSYWTGTANASAQLVTTGIPDSSTTTPTTLTIRDQVTAPGLRVTRDFSGYASVLLPPGAGVTASGTSCTITSITNGLITGAHCP